MLSFIVAAAWGVTGAAPAHADHYDHLLAPESTCPNQADASQPPAVQKTAMVCMINEARTRSGLSAVRVNGTLTSSAQSKAADLLTCQDFSHTACGRVWPYWITEAGYYRPGQCYGAGENLSWGNGTLATVRVRMGSMLHSDDHRKNILKPKYRDVGIGLVQGDFRGYAGSQVWAQHFGFHC